MRRQLLDDPAGGAVKINKVLYFAECAHIRTYGVPITGVAYQKLPKVLHRGGSSRSATG